MSGKFSHSADEFVYNLSMDGTEQEASYEDGGGWYGLIHLSQDDKWGYYRASADEFDTDYESRRTLFGNVGAILWEDSQGFVSVGLYASESELSEAWNKIESDMSEYYGEDDTE